MKLLASLFVLALSLVSVNCLSQSTPVHHVDSHEIKLSIPETQLYSLEHQQSMRRSVSWQTFVESHIGWSGFFSGGSTLPHRAYGPGIIVSGSTPEERAQSFVAELSETFNFEASSLTLFGSYAAKDLDIVEFKQIINGYPVSNSRLIVKFQGSKVILFGIDLDQEFSLNTGDVLSSESATSAAANGIGYSIVNIETNGGLSWLMLGTGTHLVRELTVFSVGEDNMPANYHCWVDATTNELLGRVNTVRYSGGCPQCKKGKEIRTMGMMSISGNVTAELYPVSILEGSETVGLPNLFLNLDGGVYTDENGDFSVNQNGPTSTTIGLTGLWSTVLTDGATPEFNLQLADGVNSISFDGNANLRELSAYNSVNRIHDHMKTYLPDFDGLDLSMNTNIDVAGTCNAFYDGEINFFDAGGGCNPSSLIADVVYHEYGHAINDIFYQDNGQPFNNGAMHEGYADLWAISLTNNPHLGQGFFDDSTDGIRRYDINPKVYPQDLVGEVHADGEIICGAWYDTHLLMGGDWNATMELFSEAYVGWQATAMNGDEGTAFFDVLIDVLQADDDDGDLTNGTPNDLAILEGFAIHGIYLLADAEIIHDNLLSAAGETMIDIEADVLIEFPWNVYLEQVNLNYKINNEVTWSQAVLTNTSGDTYAGQIPAQDNGTVIAYYFTLEDIYGFESGTSPVGVTAADPTLPYFTLVGVQLEAEQDCDFNEDWGQWQTGVAGDLATAGQWELNIPIGSFAVLGDPSTIVAPDTQHTDVVDAEFCFITQQSPSADGSIYDTDVDDGGTTLRSPVIDLSSYEMPIISYWRWLAHQPNGSSLNNALYVQVSDDGGSTWVEIEATVTQDKSWRRNAFRVSDYVDITDEFMIQFIADDPVFDISGALVEAAVDDIYLWDLSDAVDVSENLTDHLFSIYPNPAQSELNVSWSLNPMQAWQVTLYDMTGKLVAKSASLTSLSTRLSTSQLAAGSYTLRIWTNDHTYTRKLIID